MLNHKKQFFVSTWFTAPTKSLCGSSAWSWICVNHQRNTHKSKSHILTPHKIWKGNDNSILWPKWPSPNNKFDNCQLVYSLRSVRCCSSAWNEYRVRTHAHKHFKSVHRSIESFISGQSHVECVHSISIAGWRTSWNQIEYVETNQNKTKQLKKEPKEPNNFNVEVLLNVIEFYCVHERYMYA